MHIDTLAINNLAGCGLLERHSVNGLAATPFLVINFHRTFIQRAGEECQYQAYFATAAGPAGNVHCSAGGGCRRKEGVGDWIPNQGDNRR